MGLGLSFHKNKEEAEEFYRKECDDMLFRTGREIFIENREVYMQSDAERTWVLTIEKPQKQWYQIWLYLKGVRT